MSTRTGLVFEQTFNTGSNLGSMGFVQEGNATGRVTDVGGQRAVSLTLNHYGDAVPIRTELQPTGLPDPYFSNGMHAKYGQTYWYGIKSMLPGNWRLDSAPESVMQWHDWPDAGEAWKNPAVALLIENKADGAHYTVHVRSDSKAMTPSSGTRYDSFKQYDLGKVADSVGKWTEWVWKIKWGYDSSGSLSLYKNGQEVLNLPSQGNCFNDQRGPYFKFGTYKWDWESSADTGADSRTKYFDDLRIAAGPNANYDSVAPTQHSTTPGNIAPNAADDTARTTAGLTVKIAVLANDSDADGDPISIMSVATPSNGAAKINTDGTISYTPKVGFTGADTFSYIAKDTQGLADTAKVTVTITSAGTVLDSRDSVPASPSLAGDTVTKSISYTLVSGEDNLIVTGTGSLTGMGNAGANTIVGNKAANVLGGNSGNDLIYGNDGNDQLYGGGGNDKLFGGAGSDLLMGNDGKDVLSGGSGADRFVFTLTTQSAAGAANRDEITDFVRAEGDRIDLSGIDASTKAAGDQAFIFIGSQALSGIARQMHAVPKDGMMMIEGDVNGDKIADFQIGIHSLTPLQASDFLL